METIFPTDAGFDGMFAVGFRKKGSPPSDTERVGTVVVKRTYTIRNGQMQPDRSGEAVRMADEVEEQTIDGDPVFIVRRESDLAPFKPQADLVVLGFFVIGENDNDFGDEGEVSVDSNLWLQRPSEKRMDLANDPDALTNLFGWDQRMFEPRVSDIGPVGFSTASSHYPAQWPVPVAQPERDPLHPVDFSNRFFNGFRRGWQQPGSFPYYTGSPQISVTRTGTSDTETVQFTLPDEPLESRFFYYCGHGPDRDSRWCDQEIPLVRDTLVVEPKAVAPDVHRAYALWRGAWDFDTHADDLYRRLEVKWEA